MGKLPYITFYTGDWLKDQIAGCSLAAQGLWLRLMIVAHDADHYGYLAIEGVAIPPERLARMCAATLEQYTTLLAELDSAHVPSWTPEGVMYSRRMVKDARERGANAKRQAKFKASKVTQESHFGNGQVTHDSQRSSYSVSSSVATSGEGEGLPPPPQISAGGVAGNGADVVATPSKSEVADYAILIGLAEWKALDWWQQMEGIGWLLRGQYVRKWRLLCDRVKTQWEADGRPMKRPGYRCKSEQSKPSVLDLKNVIEAKKIEADKLKLEHSSEVATGVHWSDQEARKEWVRLRSEIREINHRISTYCDS